jgi:hypothetical protein
VERTLTLETGASDRRANMHAFAARALTEFLGTLEAAKS